MNETEKTDEVNPELDEQQMEEAKKIINSLLKQSEDNKTISDTFQNGFRTGFIKGFQEGLIAMKFVYAEISNELQSVMEKLGVIDSESASPSKTETDKNQNFYN